MVLLYDSFIRGLYAIYGKLRGCHATTIHTHPSEYTKLLANKLYTYSRTRRTVVNSVSSEALRTNGTKSFPAVHTHFASSLITNLSLKFNIEIGMMLIFILRTLFELQTNGLFLSVMFLLHKVQEYAYIIILDCLGIQYNC